MNVTTTAKDYIKHEIEDDDYSDPLRFSGFHGLPPDKEAFAISSQFQHQQEDFIKSDLEDIDVKSEPQPPPTEKIYIKCEFLTHSGDNKKATNFWSSKISKDTAEGERFLAYPGKSNLSEESNVLNSDFKEETLSVTYDAGGNDFVDGVYEFPGSTFDDNKSKNIYNQTKECNVSVARLSTHTNYSCESHSDSTSTGNVPANVNINDKKEQSVKNPSTIHKEGTNSPSLHKANNNDTDKDNIFKEEHNLESFKAEKPLNTKPFRSNVCDYRAVQKRTLNNRMQAHTGEIPYRYNVCDVRVTQKGSLDKQENSSGSSSTATEIIGEISQDFHNAIHDDFVKEEHEVTFKIETDEALSFKEGNSNNNEEERSDDCKTGIGDHVKEEIRSTKYDADGNNELHNLTSAKSLQTTNKTPKSVRHNGSKNLSKPEQASSTTKSFSCKICKYRTTLKCNLVRHIRIHTGEKPFHCNVCEYRAVHKHHLINHMLTHTSEKPFQCDVCDYRAVQKRQLNSHMLTHTSEKLLQCKVCGYRAVHNQNLVNHLRTHTGEKPFQCNICDYRAIQKQYLIGHMRTHTGEKLLQCNVCDYKAVQKQNLITHIRIHTGEKPFKCNVCDYRAVQKQNLINHMRTHTGEKPFKCNVCDYRAIQKQHLIVHIRSHTGEKPFRCYVCDLKLTEKGNLVKHMRIHTGEKQ